MASEIENTEWPDDEMSIKRFNPANPFNVPSGYFDELDQRIMSSVYLNEFKENNPAEGFTIPDNYFDTSAEQIFSRIQIEELASSEAESFAVPQDYFSNLEQQINSRIVVEEALASSSEEAFSVPQDYFEKLNKSILNKTVNQDMVMRKAGIIRKMVTSGAFKYASAACVAIIVGVGIFLTQDNMTVNTHSQSSLHKELSKIPATEIESYLENNMDPSDVQHTMASEDAPVNFNNLDSSLDNTSAQK